MFWDLVDFYDVCFATPVALVRFLRDKQPGKPMRIYEDNDGRFVIVGLCRRG